MATYRFNDLEMLFAERIGGDGSIAGVPWGSEGPLGGEAWRQWDEDGKPTPAPYVAPPAPPRSIHVAWFRAALADAGKLDAVEAAVAGLARSKQILWEYASEVSENDPDVKTVAAALAIDLAAVFDAAEAIRDGRK